MNVDRPTLGGFGGLARQLDGPRHYLDLRDLDTATLRTILDVAIEMKAAQQGRRFPLHPRRPLAGRTLGLMMEKPSTRTRVSFEVAMRQLGGDVIVLSPRDTQLGRGETIPDTARVLSRFLDALVLRTDDPRKLHELVEHSSIPVINGLTASSHPVQILADILTFEEHRGPIAGQVVAWCGDGNNVANSWIEAAVRFGFTLRLATPPDLAPEPDLLDWARKNQGSVIMTRTPQEAVAGARCVVTDTWTSMSDDPDEDWADTLEPYRVDSALMELAAPDALFMHCLPAHRGEEVTDAVIDGRWSVVLDEAENRLHAQKGLLMWALGGAEWIELARIDTVGSSVSAARSAHMNEPPNPAPSSTEETPAAPGWVEQAVDEIFADLASRFPNRPSLRGLRNGYLDCVASAGRTGDIDEVHDRCRGRLIEALVEQEGVAPELARSVEQKLEALEAEISARI